MSDSSGEKTEASDVELKSIVVNTNETPKRGSCWEYNVSEQFPLASVPSTSGQAEIIVGAPHEGYSIMTTLKNSKMNGESSIRSESNVLVARLNFVDGIASGPCTLFDEDGLLFFTGHFVDGYREGRGKEYDENKDVIFDGFYEKGKKLPIFPVKEMGEDYWKELDAEGNIVKICQKNDFNNYNGWCFEYSNKEMISKISEWENGEEIAVWKEFNDDIMTEYHDGKKVYKGEYLDSLESRYPRDGEGEEFDIDPSCPEYQHVKIVVTRNWAGSDSFAHFMEYVVYGSVEGVRDPSELE